MSVVLLSAGRHPATGRPRPAASDLRALQLARAITSPNYKVIGLHAGPSDADLQVYAGFGDIHLFRLDVPADTDVYPTLFDWLYHQPTTLMLAGARAEHGRASGLLPYALAARLGAACIPDVAAIEAAGERVTLIQALEGGRRRRLAAPFPAMLTAASSAPAPASWAYARAARAAITVLAAAAAPLDPTWRIEPARPLARPVKKLKGGASARLAAATSFATGKGRLLVSPPPEEAAKAIADYLEAEGLLRR